VIARNNSTAQSTLGSIAQALSGTGLLEINIGSGGVTGQIGSGGINVGGAVYDIVKRGLDKAALEKVLDTQEGKTAYDLYVHGDWTAENTAMRVANGKDDLVFVEKGGLGSETRYGRTVQNGNGGRTITIANMGHADNVVTLGHEAYRDGIVRNENYVETRQAVLAHIELADRMRNAGYSFNGDGVVGLDIGAYDYARVFGDMTIMDAYADTIYNSEEDYFDISNFFFGDTIGEVKDFLMKNVPIFEFIGLLDAASRGDASAEAKIYNIAGETADRCVAQGREVAGFGADVAGKVSDFANNVAIGSIALGVIPIAIKAEGIAAIADTSGLVLSLLAGDEKKAKKFVASVILNLAFRGVSKFVPIPEWNSGSIRYHSSTTGRFVKTEVGQRFGLTQHIIGKVVPSLFEGDVE
jgi:hypothetical protein